MSGEIKISERERRVLQVLADYYDSEANCRFMKGIAEELDLTVIQTRRALRSLARKGLTELVRGLFDEDGQIAGSGYCCTPEGKRVVDTSGQKLL